MMKILLQNARDLRRAEGGNVALMLALTILPLTLLAGFAVDFSRVESQRQDLQYTLDNAVIAAALSEPVQIADAIRNTFDATISNFDSTQSNLAAVNISQNGPTIEVTATATADVQLAFAGILGRDRLRVNVTSVAVVGENAPTPCVFVLSPDEPRSLIINDGAIINAPGCSLEIASTAPLAVTFNAGIDVDVANICIASDDVLDNARGSVDYTTSCAVAPEPFGASIPQPDGTDCDFMGRAFDGVDGDITLTPGTYCGEQVFNPGVDVDFEPGLYIIRGGDWALNGGEWVGRDVSFYFEDASSLFFNNGSRSTLTAPTNGPYEDLMFFEKKGLERSGFAINNNDGFEIDGLVWLPSRDFIMNSNSNVRGKRLSMVTNTLIINDGDVRFGTSDIMDGLNDNQLLVRLVR